MDESIASPSVSHDLDAAFTYCADQLRHYDHDRYTICIGVEKELRRFLLALYAFNLEVAKTREVVSEPTLGRIRLQWWREAIDGIYGGRPRKHPVVTALAAAMTPVELPRHRFDRLIDGREFDLEDRQPDTLDDLVAYADATSGELACLALEYLGVDRGPVLEKGRQAGIAWALNGLIRAIPYQATQRRCYVPESLTRKHGISVFKLYAGKNDAKLANAVAELASAAYGHLEQARAGPPDVPSRARPVFSGLPVVAAELKRLRKSGYDVYSVKPLGPFRRRWLLSPLNSWLT